MHRGNSGRFGTEDNTNYDDFTVIRDGCSADSTAHWTYSPAARTTMYDIVYFDLETTGLSTTHAGILQIAAISQDFTFSTYLMPWVPIGAGATAVHGMYVHHGRLYRGNQPLYTTTRRKACCAFLDYLADFDNQVILVAHNGHNFDVPLLMRDMELEGLLDDLHDLVAGTVDTMDVFDDKLPCYNGPSNFKLPTVAAYLGVPTYGAHDALRDAEILQDVCDRLDVSADEMWDYSKELPY